MSNHNYFSALTGIWSKQKCLSNQYSDLKTPEHKLIFKEHYIKIQWVNGFFSSLILSLKKGYLNLY